MTDPVSNRDIEDVLSSIRRLVSQETLHHNDEKGPAVSGTQGTVPGKLVLTPAQRIADPAPACDPSDAATTPAPTAMRPAAAIVAQQNIDQGDANRLIPAVNTPAATLESTIAALEAAISSSAEHWETDGADDLPSHAGNNVTPLHRLAGAAERKAPTPQSQATAPQAQASAVQAQAQATNAPPVPVDKHVMMAPLRLTTADAVPPPGVAPETRAVPPSGASAGAAAPFGNSAEMRDPTDDADPADDADLIDEDTLHDMVVEIVRAELQGQLGERITRNIRKLVRTEVARALAEKQYL